MPRVLHFTTARFEAARRLHAPDAPARLRHWHGHSFVAYLEANLPTRWASFPGAEIDDLREAVTRSLSALDYSDLAATIAEPSDVALAEWIARTAAIPGWHSVHLHSAPGAHVEYSREGKQRVARRYRFEAAHRLPQVPPEHQCGRMHGHGFEVELVAGLGDEPEWNVAARLDAAWREIHALVDHACLNDLEGLANPTSEILAHWIWRRVAATVDGLAQVSVLETATAGARFDGTRYAIWKDQRFDAATRLRQAPGSDPRACLHGHSYLVRLTLAAPLDTVLGWVVDFGDVKSVFAPIYRALDHRRLDEDEAGDCASVLASIAKHAAPLLPALNAIELQERPGCGAKMVGFNAKT